MHETAISELREWCLLTSQTLPQPSLLKIRLHAASGAVTDSEGSLKCQAYRASIRTPTSTLSLLYRAELRISGGPTGELVVRDAELLQLDPL